MDQKLRGQPKIACVIDDAGFHSSMPLSVKKVQTQVTRVYQIAVSREMLLSFLRIQHPDIPESAKLTAGSPPWNGIENMTVTWESHEDENEED